MPRINRLDSGDFPAKSRRTGHKTPSPSTGTPAITD
jgi:hypothetical protein